MVNRLACVCWAVAACVPSDGAEDEIVVGRTVTKLGEIRVERTKLLNPSTLAIREVARDLETGYSVSYVELRDDAQKQWRETYGAADPALVAALGGAGSVSIDIELAETIDPATVRIRIAELGGTIVRFAGRRLVVRAEPTAVQQIAKLDGVELATAYREPVTTAMNAAKDLKQGVLAVAHQSGWGEGIRSAIYELDACIVRTHPDFASITWESRHTSSPCNPNTTAGHATAVAGVYAADRGGTNTAGMFAGRMFDVDARSPMAVEDMWKRFPQLVVAAWTISLIDARRIDTEAYNHGTFVFNGSGNNSADVANCYAYNAVCVGGYETKGTFGSYTDDTPPAGAYSYLNYENREGPSLVGPYSVGATASYRGGYAGGSGTSFATPAVAGLAGLLLTNYSGALWQRPSLMRAVLMASAQAHPVRDGGRRIPRFNDAVDDRMGVGAPHGDRAITIMSARTYKYLRATPQQLGTQATFAVKANERVRVVLAWDQCPYTTGATDLRVDLDLAVKAPNNMGGTSTHTNVSFHDNWEVVEFIAPVAGTATISVDSDRFEACPSENNTAVVPMSIAWTKEPAPLVIF
jgi:hypothetical protein